MRKSKLTIEVQMKICEALRGGNYREVAVQWAGVPLETFNDWMKRKDERYIVFQRAIEEAERAAEVRAVALVMKAAGADPRHAQWWLERKFPERWARKERHEVTGEGGGAVKVEHGIRVFLPEEERG